MTITLDFDCESELKFTVLDPTKMIFESVMENDAQVSALLTIRTLDQWHC